MMLTCAVFIWADYPHAKVQYLKGHLITTLLSSTEGNGMMPTSIRFCCVQGVIDEETMLVTDGGALV